MMLTSASIRNVIHPTAAFSPSVPKPSSPPSAKPESQSWLHSQLNPKNRIDSLESPANPLWRIDGCAGQGTQFYALPLFLGNHIPPLRFDVFLPQEAGSCQRLRDLLDLDAAFHTKDAVRVQRLGISRHILRTLQAWTQSSQQGDNKHSFAEMYRNLPFGSRIIFENLEFDIRNIKITIAQTFHLEGQLLGLSKLGAQLGLPQESLPEPIDIFRLRIVRQLTESVCLVRMEEDDDDDDGMAMATDAANGTGAKKEKLWILKALTSGTKYLYTELRNLLQMPPHPHVISRPVRLVAKQCQFGGKNAVVGFMIPYYPDGSLRDTLPLLRIHGQPALKDQLKWAIQLAQGLLHINDKGQMYYPDLRLDNILLSEAGDIVMVDFEQRGLWSEFGAPEVNALDYVRILASDSLLEDNDLDLSIPENITERYAALLTRELPDWEALETCENYSQRPEGYTSFNIAWLCLSKAEQEAAVVYMLGRLLWCIFEGQSGPDKAAFWQSYTREPDLQFPEMRYTPAELRGLVDKCTRGRREVLSSLVTRRGSKLVLLREKDTHRGSCLLDGTVTDEEGEEEEKVLQVAKNWWTAEVKAAEDFLQMRHEMKERGVWNENYFGRPSLREVINRLEDFQKRSLP